MVADSTIILSAMTIYMKYDRTGVDSYIYCNDEIQKINDKYKNKDQKNLPKNNKFNVPKINNLQSASS